MIYEIGDIVIEAIGDQEETRSHHETAIANAWHRNGGAVYLTGTGNFYDRYGMRHESIGEVHQCYRSIRRKGVAE